MVVERFHGRIRRVFNNGSKWIADVYGTENREYNGCFDVQEDTVGDVRRLSKVPQILAMISVSHGRIIRIETEKLNY